MGTALARSKQERLRRIAYIMITGDENNFKKNAEDVLGCVNIVNGSGVCSIDGSIPHINTRSVKPRNKA